ncbi:hypothetical protein BH10PLA1_BH10PLA1_20360 [soil metagenome]
MEVGQKCLIAIYVLAPLAAVVRAVWLGRKGRRTAIPAVVSTVFMSLLLGAGLNAAYAFVAGGRVRGLQVLLSSYILMAVIVIMRAFSSTMETGLRTLFNVRRGQPQTISLALRAGAASLIRGLMLVMLGLPFVLASVMIFRPKIALRDDPQRQLGSAFQPVEFVTSDDVPIRAWWIPSETPTRDTVVVCHGLGANKSNQLTLAAHFLPAGFNVLIFDFRAHGESGGQITSFGDLERNDVLAAVHWLRTNRHEQSKRIFGVGASMGGAALLAAAGEDNDDARAIDAIAVYGTYDSLYDLAADIVTTRLPPPLDWLMMRVALPIASLHAGTHLSKFAPIRALDHIAPRPILFIHGTEDAIIPFARGEALYNAASQPKYRLWINKGDHNEIINDPATGKIVSEFFKAAMSVI